MATSISTGYTNPYPNTAAATSAPANFGPGQVQSATNSAENGQSKVQEASENERRKGSGYTTDTRGGNLNITV